MPTCAPAVRCFTQAEQLAESLGETLERAKIWHTRAELLLRDGDSSRAQELATSALETFTQSRTRYDVTHTRVTVSRAAFASGQERLAVQHGALARSSVQVMGYSLLCVLYPEDVFDLAGRIDGALTAYACGDALGLPLESPPGASAHATSDQIEQLPAREGWPRGAGGLAAGVGQGRLPASDHPKPGRDGHRATWGTGLSSGTRQPCTNPRPFPTVSAGTDPPPGAPTWTTAPSIPSPPARCAGYICQVPWARMDGVRAQHDVLLGNADRISPPPG